MRVSVFGLGYVGAVSAACLAKLGHTVVGVDVNRTKVDIINSGRSPIIEAELGSLISLAVGDGRLRCTTTGDEAVAETDLSLVCVGTPSLANGSLDLGHVERVSAEIGEAIAQKEALHTVVVRSTVLPGTVEGVVIPILERASGKRCGEGFGVAFNPEFLRESTAAEDFFHPPKTVVGAASEAVADQVAGLYEGVEGALFKTSIKVSEMVKYVDNIFHALKVTFGNEIGSICKAVGVDSHEVMRIFCADTKLNLSPYYLKPGFAFGGSCLPKDLRAMRYHARHLDLSLPVIEAIQISNEVHIERAIRQIMGVQKRKIGFLGFAFKAGTDDLRESPMVTLAETLLGKGYDIRIHDRAVSLARLFGANKEFVELHLPHLSALMVDSLEQLLAHAEIVVIGTKDPEHLRAFPLLKEDQVVLDLVRLSEPVETLARYEGICW